LKRLIVNADDFGMAESVNDGIIKGHRDGIITSTSFMAGARAAEHAAILARDNPSLGVGVHLCLTLVRPVADPSKIRSLAPNGVLPNGPLPLMSRLLIGSIKIDEVEIELRAQIERTLALGIKPDHIDGHQHVHMMKRVFDVALKLAEEYAIPAMRYPVGPDIGRVRGSRGLEKKIFEGIARKNRRAIEDAGIKFPDCFFGFAETGNLDPEKLLTILEALPDGTSELMCHPGLPSETLAEDNWGAGWGMELEAVTDESIREKIKAEKIQLIKFSSLN
jgi:hopanoid biosynthesis associated protein HpnK